MLLTWPLSNNTNIHNFMDFDSFNSRGQESAGIATSSGKEGCKYAQKKGMGLVSSIFQDEDLVKLKGNLGIGNTCIL